MVIPLNLARLMEKESVRYVLRCHDLQTSLLVRGTLAAPIPDSISLRQANLDKSRGRPVRIE